MLNLILLTMSLSFETSRGEFREKGGGVAFFGGSTPENAISRSVIDFLEGTINVHLVDLPIHYKTASTVAQNSGLIIDGITASFRDRIADGNYAGAVGYRFFGLINVTKGIGSQNISEGISSVGGEIYAKAPVAKLEIYTMVDEIAGMFAGKVAKAPIKSQYRAIQKIMEDYGGDATRIKGLARNTIIVSPDKVDLVAVKLACHLQIQDDLNLKLRVKHIMAQ